MPTTYVINEISKKLRPIFKPLPIYKVVLFGSYSKGMETKNSDVDIVIDSRGEIRGLNFYSLLDEIVETLNIDVDLFDASEIQKDSSIYNEIVKNGVTLYER